MKTVNLMFTLPIYLIMLVALSEAQLDKQGSQVDISKRVAEWLGEEPTSKWRTSLGWLEVNVYSSESGQVFVDTNSREIIMMSLCSKKQKEKTQNDIGMERALSCALHWMEQRGIRKNGWKLEEKRRYDREDGGIEYMFTWLKYSQEGVQLPCFMKVIVSGEGDVNFWFCVQKQVSISLIPNVSEKDALMKAKSIIGEEFHSIEPPRLRVWFRDGKQQLWWEIVFRSNKAGRAWEAVVIINAHTGELVDLFRPLGVNWMEEERKKYLQNARKVAKELGKCVKVEIFHMNVLDKPIAVFKQNDKRFQSFLSAVRKLLNEGEGIIGAPPYLLFTEFQVRFYIAPNIAYETKLSLRAAYFQVLEKIQLRKKEGKEIWQQLEVIPVVVHKCPKEFVQQLVEIMKQIPKIRIKV